MPFTDEEEAKLKAMLADATPAELEEIAEEVAEEIADAAEETGEQEEAVNAEVAEVLADEVHEEIVEGDVEDAVELVEEIIEIAGDTPGADVDAGTVADVGESSTTDIGPVTIESDSPPLDVPPRTDHWWFRKWGKRA